MTSQGDSLKKNEFLRLRKLRLQQVREQSKDIAKKIRLRAKVEQLRHVTKVDPNKEKDYLQRQEKLVKRLELLHSKSIQNVGDGHKSATEVSQKVITEKKDLAKLRGIEAAAELRRKRQEKLNEQKKLLDRKLQAREVANELSREKIAVVTNTLHKSSSGKSVNEERDKSPKSVSENDKNTERIRKDSSAPLPKNDMGTQWEFEEMPNEWEPNVPKLAIPIDDGTKISANDNVETSDKVRRLNLFALSDEMPSSLRGGITSNMDDKVSTKPSLTLVSEFIQNRDLRLREPDIINKKKGSDDLHSIKQTLLRSRASRTDGSVFPNICHVLDEQVIPVPCWTAEKNCDFCSKKKTCFPISYHFKTNSIFSVNNNQSTLSRRRQEFLFNEKPKVGSRSHSPNCRPEHKLPVSGRTVNTGNSCKSNSSNYALNKKASVTMYDHNTRDTRDVPHNVDEFVVRDQSNDDDAYSQALREASAVESSEKPQCEIHQEARTRLAVERQTVDKEYRDTLAFLNSLPKEKPIRPIRTAYMDGERQQEFIDRRQQRLEKEYKKIEKQCSKPHYKKVNSKSCSHKQNRSKSNSPGRVNIDTNRDFEYSWMPVPESDGSLAIHSLPLKDNKVGNSVKFSSVDTYHEYRSRHKHTPPTKDDTNIPNKRIVEAVMIQENSTDSSNETDTSSVENLQVHQDKLGHKVDKVQEISNAEKIIIYKVVESKKAKKHKTKKKSIIKNKVINDTCVNENTEVEHQDITNISNKNRTEDRNTNNVSSAQLKEGIYKNVRANGDNIAAMQFSGDQEDSHNQFHDGGRAIRKELNINGSNVGKDDEEVFVNRSSKQCGSCNINEAHSHSGTQASAATSTSSFKTAVNDKPNNILRDDGYIQFIDNGVQDTGKFYVGASGFLKDDAYEVIIQLRKKEVDKMSENIDPHKNRFEASVPVAANKENIKLDILSTSVQLTNLALNSPKTSIHQTPKESVVVNTTGIDTIQEPKVNQVSSQEETNGISNQNKNTVKPAVTSDKSISTSFHDSFAIPNNIEKSDPILRKVTSIYTQTSQNSPPPMHVRYLSSSTSTTYMSPPDLVLPRYLRKHSSDTYDDTYELLSSNFNSLNFKASNRQSCRHRKFKKQDKVSDAETPPNTSRSTELTVDNFVRKQSDKINTDNEKRWTKPKPHRCKINSEPKICNKKKLKKSLSVNKSGIHTGSNYSLISNKRRKVPNNLAQASLNPVIESYVKKLLALNREGLKAIEVVNQQCSGITTPGSSIIDVPSNITHKNPKVCNKISLEEIKNSLKEHILQNVKKGSKSTLKTTGIQTDKHFKLLPKSIRKRPVHKVKSLNISKQLIKTNKYIRRESARRTTITTSPCYMSSSNEKNSQVYSRTEKCKSENRKSPSPRHIMRNDGGSLKNINSNTKTDKYIGKPQGENLKPSETCRVSKPEIRHKSESYLFPSHKATITSQSSESDASNPVLNNRNFTSPISISTQTNHIDSEAEFMLLAENKLQNMEKIADLTEKCTQRLSNLAKVLEEVRKNKSLVYSQISSSDTTSDSDQKLDKNVQENTNRVNNFNTKVVEIQTLKDVLSSQPANPQEKKIYDISSSSSYIPILTDLPKPNSFKTSSPSLSFSTDSNNSDAHIATDAQSVKHRGRPPPALTRINLKHVPEGFVIPHELSTVIEVDSPMSVKLKSHTTPIDNKHEVSKAESSGDSQFNEMNEIHHASEITQDKPLDPKILVDKLNVSKRGHKTQSADSSGDSKIKMMDLKHFNEIMLKPFISLQEYAKQYNLEEPKDGSNQIGISKDENANEELSSVHSGTSLPDVMAELLKRNLINEPFKFETTSNVNSTTVSSESTMSMLALSKARNEKRKSAMFLRNKENVAETSESLSISSNPDLEQVFQNLGLGWASSTLKKTKERLALSSSSNTSSSSMSQLKIKSFNYNEVPELSKDSIISSLNMSKKEVMKEGNKESLMKPHSENSSENPRNELQQTSLTNSMTVKEFLANELAKKITFSNKINRNATEEEFISLCETQMPDELKQKLEEKEKSVDSIPSGTNNRARTSTPVQFYKSMTYHSTSSSNTSNGLFSNADDLSSVKVTSNSMKNHSTSDKDDLTIPNYSLKMRKGLSECSKSD